MGSHTKQNPVLYYLSIVLYMIAALLIRCVALSPLAALLIWETGPLRLLSLLCPILFIFIVLPFRFSFADALLPESGSRHFDFSAAFSFDRYGSKLTHSLVHAGKLLLWGIPTYAVCGYTLYLHFYGKNMALLQLFPKLGKFSLTVIYAVRNFFTGIFGAEALVVPNSTMAEGIITGLAILLFTLLIWFFGVIRNSSDRYLWVLSERNGTTFRKEKRIHLMGRRGAQLANSLVNLVLGIPFIVICVIIFKPALSDVANNLLKFVTTGVFYAGDLSKALLPLILNFVFLYFLVLPLRRIRTAHFVIRSRKQQ